MTATETQHYGDTRTALRTCPLCEATCGLTLTLREPGRGEAEFEVAVEAVRGDAEHVLSHGYICPKGVALGAVHADPDRLRRPLVKRGGEHVEVSWDEAFAEVGRLLGPILAEHGPDAVGVYLGNPNVHNYASTLYAPVLIRALGIRNRFSASTVDQMPKQVASGLMYGTDFTIAVPDVDRTDYLLVLGADPVVSNGSLLTAPDLPGRLRALRKRGGRLVVVDPRRSRTAEVADEHLPIRPAGDPLLLAAIVTVLDEEGLVDLGPAQPHLAGVRDAVRALSDLTPETVAERCGIAAHDIRRIARELAAAPSAAVYGRVGTTTTEYGTLTSWLIDVVNILTGNLDRPGGVMFPKSASGSANTMGEPGRGRGVRIPGSQRSRVRGAPSVFGELPVAVLAEEIDTPGPDGAHLRALITIAGNPALSTPNNDRLGAALAQLDCLISIDAYLNETTRHAHVVLPSPSSLTRSHYDLAFSQLAVRDVAVFSPPSVPLGPDELDEGEILLRLAALAARSTPDQLDELVLRSLAEQRCADPSSRAYGLDVTDVLDALAGRRRQERLLDLMLRSGPYGDGFGSHPEGLSLAVLEANPHGVDLGALRPRLPEVLRTPSGKVEVAPEQILAEVPRLSALLSSEPPRLVLVGRRQLRSNNSWMHNVEALAGGSNACLLQVHPLDAERLGLTDGLQARVRSRAGSLTAPVQVTDAVRPGVVSLPHGWGHDQEGSRMRVARENPGVSSNVLTDELVCDPLSGTAALNGVPVEVWLDESRTDGEGTSA